MRIFGVLVGLTLLMPHIATAQGGEANVESRRVMDRMFSFPGSTVSNLQMGHVCARIFIGLASLSDKLSDRETQQSAIDLALLSAKIVELSFAKSGLTTEQHERLKEETAIFLKGLVQIRDLHMRVMENCALWVELAKKQHELGKSD